MPAPTSLPPMLMSRLSPSISGEVATPKKPLATWYTALSRRAALLFEEMSRPTNAQMTEIRAERSIVKRVSLQGVKRAIDLGAALLVAKIRSMFHKLKCGFLSYFCKS